jgi:YD repeat-containing protein
MGMETMGVTNMIFEGVLGNSVLFLGYAFCWSENNMTTLLSGGSQCSYTYDKDGFPTSKTIGTGSQSTIYTFTYKTNTK